MKILKVAVLIMPFFITVAIQAQNMDTQTMKAAPKSKKAKKKQTTLFQCPMKDSPAQDKPGKCPVCGMELEKVSGNSK